MRLEKILEQNFWKVATALSLALGGCTSTQPSENYNIHLTISCPYDSSKVYKIEKGDSSKKVNINVYVNIQEKPKVYKEKIKLGSGQEKTKNKIEKKDSIKVEIYKLKNGSGDPECP